MSRQAHLCIAIDLGASNGRVSLGRLQGKSMTLETARRFEHSIVERDGTKTWDWPAILREVRAGMRDACELCGDEPVSSVSCDGWAQDFGLLDESGRLFYPPVSYRDDRTEGMPHRFSDIIAPAELQRRVGSAILPMTTLCQLRCMAEREPQVLRRAHTLLHVADLVHYALCGEKATDWTLATASQCRRVDRGRWDTELLERLDIPPHLFPRIAETPAILGRIPADSAPHEKLVNVPVVIGAGHDTSAASAAVSPMSKGSLFLSAGTWTMLGCCTDEFFFPEAAEEGTVGVLGLALGKWALFSGGMGLWLLQECRRMWKEQGVELSYDALEQGAAAAAIESRVNGADPRFFAPRDMLQEIAAACRETGQQVPREPGDFSRVVYESLAHGISDSVSTLRHASGLTMRKLRVVSGGSKDAFFCRRLAEVSGLPVSAGPAEATTIGNVLMQAWALDLLGSEAELRQVVEASFPATTYTP